METIINEFSQWWNDELRYSNDMRLPSRMYFCEARGTNYEEFNSIVTQLYNYLDKLNGKPYLKNTEGKQYFITKPIVLAECFIKDVTFTIYPTDDEWYLSNGAGFDYTLLKYDKNEEKCYNCQLTLYANNSDVINFKGIDVISLLWHEVQHIYRQYNVLKKEDYNGKPNDKVNYSNTFQSNVLRYYGSQKVDFIRDICYLTDKDEIDARMQELIPFLQSHKDINRSNYTWYLKDCSSFQFIQYLKNLKPYFHFEILASDNIENIGTFIQRLYKETNYYSNANISPIESVNKLYKRYCEAIVYAQHQFYKILFYMFQKQEKDLNEHYYIMPKRIKRNTYTISTNKEDTSFKKLMEGYMAMEKLYEHQFK